MDNFKEKIEHNVEKEGRIEILKFTDLTNWRTEELQKQISESVDISYISKEILEDTTFDTTFKWPEKLPDGFDPEKLIEEGKNPGLGIRKLHEEGITGKGQIIAIIDQKLSESHIEFKDNLISNKEYSNGKLSEIKEEISMHGPAVASLFVGKTCGVAPEAKLYYAGSAVEKGSYLGAIKALEDIIEYNKNHEQKIKIVSFSKGHNDYPKLNEWIETKERAKESGIIVIDSKYFGDNLITGGGAKINREKFDDYELPIFYKDENEDSLENLKERFNLADKNTQKKLLEKFGTIENYYNNIKERELNNLIVPCDYRTMASRKGDSEYVYNAKGGWSWAIPYLAGVFTLALQVNQDLTNDQFLEIARKTAGKNKKGIKVINPPEIIEEVKRMIDK